jgi:hypothetical protein
VQAEWGRRLSQASSDITSVPSDDYRRMHDVVDSITAEIMQRLQLRGEYVADTHTEDAAPTSVPSSRRRRVSTDDASSSRRRTRAARPSPPTQEIPEFGGPSSSHFQAPSYDMHQGTQNKIIYLVRVNFQN